MEYKVVFHINLPDGAAVARALGNVANLLKGIGGQGHAVVVLLNGEAVTLLAGAGYPPFADGVKELHGQGVRFQTCRNSLRKFAVDPAVLPGEFEIVPAGIIALIELQNDGFAYVKP
jgi:hypothetical protein